LNVDRSKIRVLLAKPGLDGHDRGAKVVGMLLRDAGMEVIYTGLRQSIEQIISAAMQESVDVIALSVLSGVHIKLSEKLIKALKARGLSNMPVVLGGIIPPRDIAELKSIGVDEVFPVHSTFDDIIDYFDRRFINRVKK